MYGNDIENVLVKSCARAKNMSDDDFFKLDIELKMKYYANEIILDTLELFQMFSNGVLDNGWKYDIMSSRKAVLENNFLNYPCSFLNFKLFLEGQHFVINNLKTISKNKKYVELDKFLNKELDNNGEVKFFSELLVNFMDLIKQDSEVYYYFSFLDALSYIFFRYAGVISLDILKNREIFDSFEKVEYFLNQIRFISNHLNINNISFNKTFLPSVLNDLLLDEEKINICNKYLDEINLNLKIENK